MNSLQKFPVLFGWLSFIAIAHLAILPVVLTFRNRDFQDISTLVLVSALMLSIYFLVSGLSFYVSVRHVALPLMHGAAAAPNVPGPSAYLWKWLDYLYHLIIYSWPLMCSWTGHWIESALRLAWLLGASYLAYRSVLNSLGTESASEDRQVGQNQPDPA
jgi:hypothetical protein